MIFQNIVMDTFSKKMTENKINKHNEYLKEVFDKDLTSDDNKIIMENFFLIQKLVRLIIKLKPKATFHNFQYKDSEWIYKKLKHNVNFSVTYEPDMKNLREDNKKLKNDIKELESKL